MGDSFEALVEKLCIGPFGPSFNLKNIVIRVYDGQSLNCRQVRYLNVYKPADCLMVLYSSHDPDSRLYYFNLNGQTNHMFNVQLVLCWANRLFNLISKQTC